MLKNTHSTSNGEDCLTVKKRKILKFFLSNCKEALLDSLDLTKKLTSQDWYFSCQPNQRLGINPHQLLHKRCLPVEIYNMKDKILNLLISSLKQLSSFKFKFPSQFHYFCNTQRNSTVFSSTCFKRLILEFVSNTTDLPYRFWRSLDSIVHKTHITHP